jgi:hypothetical protein
MYSRLEEIAYSLKSVTTLGLGTGLICMCAAERVKGSSKRIALMFLGAYSRGTTTADSHREDRDHSHTIYLQRRSDPSCFKR